MHIAVAVGCDTGLTVHIATSHCSGTVVGIARCSLEDVKDIGVDKGDDS